VKNEICKLGMNAKIDRKRIPLIGYKGFAMISCLTYGAGEGTIGTPYAIN